MWKAQDGEAGSPNRGGEAGSRNRGGEVGGCNHGGEAGGRNHGGRTHVCSLEGLRPAWHRGRRAVMSGHHP